MRSVAECLVERAPENNTLLSVLQRLALGPTKFNLSTCQLVRCIGNQLAVVLLSNATIMVEHLVSGEANRIQRDVAAHAQAGALGSRFKVHVSLAVGPAKLGDKGINTTMA